MGSRVTPYNKETPSNQTFSEDRFKTVEYPKHHEHRCANQVHANIPIHNTPSAPRTKTPNITFSFLSHLNLLERENQVLPRRLASRTRSEKVPELAVGKLVDATVGTDGEVTPHARSGLELHALNGTRCGFESLGTGGNVNIAGGDRGRRGRDYLIQRTRAICLE